MTEDDTFMALQTPTKEQLHTILNNDTECTKFNLVDNAEKYAIVDKVCRKYNWTWTDYIIAQNPDVEPEKIRRMMANLQ